MTNELELIQKMCQRAREHQRAMEEMRQIAFGACLKSAALREKVRKTLQVTVVLCEEVRQRREAARVKIDEASPPGIASNAYKGVDSFIIASVEIKKDHVG